jgi:uncharacterized protein involved in response to NO
MPRPRRLAPLLLMVRAPVAHGLLQSACVGTTWVADLPAAGFMWLLVVRRGLVQSLRNRLPAMLHLGFLCYAIASSLYGAQSLLNRGESPKPRPGATARAPWVVHLAPGGDGHPRHLRPLGSRACSRNVDAAAIPAAAATPARIAGQILPWRFGMRVATALWCASLLPWSMKYAPVFWRPSVDARPG